MRIVTKNIDAINSAVVEYLGLGSVLCLDFIEEDPYYYYVACEDGSSYKIRRETIACRDYYVVEAKSDRPGVTSYLIKNALNGDSRFIRQNNQGYIYREGDRVELSEFGNRIYGLKSRGRLVLPPKVKTAA